MHGNGAERHGKHPDCFAGQGRLTAQGDLRPSSVLGYVKRCTNAAQRCVVVFTVQRLKSGSYVRVRGPIAVPAVTKLTETVSIQHLRSGDKLCLQRPCIDILSTVSCPEQTHLPIKGSRAFLG